MLSQTAEYALRAVVHLSTQAEPVPNLQLAERTQVPAQYLSKVMQSLARAGLVDAQRGKHGGFTLSRAADSISILDVVNAVDPLRRIRGCPLGLRGHEKLCPLHRRLDDAIAHVEQVFAATRIADLTGGTGIQPLCELVEVAHA